MKPLLPFFLHAGGGFMDLNKLSERVIGAAIEVHRVLGPGLLEGAYEECLCRELELRGMAYERQCVIPMEYKGAFVESGFRLDVLVENALVVELKACDELTRVHRAQLLTYMRLGGWRLGLLINFNVLVLKNGIDRMVHKF